jgi:predicted ATPase
VVIKTPDQRLRVFVSSTLKELAEERNAAREAISHLLLSPVMFELGARPHPASDLYRAYLNQSHIFIGIYHQSYGWVAPEMEISGLEDEYLLSEGKPRLIYIKTPAPERQPELTDFLGRIKSEDAISYKYFSSAEELLRLIKNDLALLLTERFELSDLPIDVPEKERKKPHHNLPAQVTQFVGRDEEVAEVCELLNQESVRLLNFTGPGGTGKTRLSLQVSSKVLDRFEDGVFFVSLENIDDPELVVSKTAEVLGVREGGSQPLMEILKGYLKNKHMLLVLDNFEQLTEAAPVVTQFLSDAPKIKIIITSRALLNLRGEYEYPVPPLKLPELDGRKTLEELTEFEAVRLFANRAKAANHRFELDEKNAPVIAKICARLDGLPLAIELAASRVKLFPPETILERLGERLDLLTGGALDLPERQRTLRDTIDWSYSLLSKDLQTLFARLGIFVNGFSLEQAEKICKLDEEQSLEVVDGIAVLINNSLLIQVDSVWGQPRFMMLDTIRDFALEQLEKAGESLLIQRQCIHYFTNKMNEVFLYYSTNESEGALAWVEAEHDNLRASMSWCLKDPQSQINAPFLVSPLIWFWYRRGFLTEGRTWVKRVLSLPTVQESLEGRALTLFLSGALAMWQSDLKTALPIIEEAVILGKQVENPFYLSMTLLFNGTILVNQGKDELALPLLEEARTMYSQIGMAWDQAVTTVHMGNAALGLGDVDKAQTYLDEAQELGKDIDEPWFKSFLLNNRGEVARVKGDYQSAQAYYEESEALLRAMGDKGDLARLVHNLGYVALHQGDHKKAEASFAESLAMFQKLGNQRGIAECISGLAGLSANQEEFERGAKMMGFAEVLLQGTSAAWWPADRGEIDRAVSAIKDGLEKEKFESHWQSGETMAKETDTAFAYDELFK